MSKEKLRALKGIGQKFKRGEVVLIASNLGSSMSHFPSGSFAVIEHSYTEKFGGDNDESYSVYVLPDRGSVAWYYAKQLKKVNSTMVNQLVKDKVLPKEYKEA